MSATSSSHPHTLRARPARLRRSLRWSALLTTTALAASVTGMSAAGAVGVPSSPTLSSVSASDQTLTAKFTAPASNGGAAIASYTVSCTPSGGSAVTLTVTMPAALTGVVTGLTNGASHACKVRATNSAGSSVWSNTISATPRTVPNAPSIASVTPGNNQLSVALSPNGSGGATITGYKVTCVGPATVAVLGSASPVVVRPLVNGSSYACTAQASNAAGLSDASAATSGTPADIVPVPTGLAVTPSATSLRATFTKGAANGSAPVTSFRLSCTATVNDAPVTVSASATGSPITLAGLVNGRAYTCVVRAITSIGTLSEPSSSVEATPRTVPGTPVPGAVTAGDGQLELAFTAPASNGGATITAYTATCVGASVTKRATVAGDAASVTVTGLANGVAQSCRIVATNVAGASASSAAVLGTPRTVPTAPGRPTVSPRNQAVALAWTVPASSGGSAVTDYTIEQQVSEDGGATYGEWAAVTDTVSATPSLLVTELVNGTTYRYRVTATNAAGSSPVSAVSPSVTPRTVPGTPSATGTPANGAALLSFTAPAANGAVITEYSGVCRVGATTKTVTAMPTPVAGVYTLTVTGLTNGTVYGCTVKATNAAGSGAASAQVNVTPRTTPTAPAVTSITSADQALIVNFAAPASTGGNAIDEYLVSCATGTGAPVTETVTVPAELTAEVSGLTNGATYSCTVQAHNAAGYSVPSAGVTSIPRRVPDAPVAGTASIANTQSSVSFTTVPVANNGGATVSGYTATCAPTNPALDTREATGVTSPLIVRNLVNGAEYSCTVVAWNIVGASAPSAPMTVTPRTTAAAPASLAGTPGNTEVALSWTASASDGGAAITDHTIQSSSDGGSTWTTVSHGPVTGTSYTVEDLTNGTAYRFRVAAVNDRGASSYSRVAGPITPRTVAGAPTDVSGVIGNAQVALSWTAPASNGGAAVTDYTIQSSTDAGTTWTTVPHATQTTTSYIVTGLTNGTAYTFQVAAVNAAGTGAYSDASASLTPITRTSPPTGLSATPANTELALAWTAPASTGGAAITDYTISISEDAGATWTAVSHDPAVTGTSYTITGLTNGTRYRVKVAAVNAAGTSVASNTASATPRTVPDAPDAPTVVPHHQRLSVSFDAVTGTATGGAPITGYTVTCNDGSADTVVSTTATTAQVTGLTNGTEYSCVVTAHNVAGASGASSATTGTPRTVPGAPTLTGLTVADGELTAAFDAPASDGGNAITGYTVTCTGPDTAAHAITNTASPLAVTGLTNGVPYSCVAVATNDAGNSAPSEALVGTPVTVPDAVVIASVSAHDGALEVAFTDGASDGGTAITSYTVSCTDGTETLTETGTDSPITVTGLTNGTEYSCTVVATNAVGNADASDAVTGTPVSAPDAPSISGVTAGSHQLAVAFSAPASGGGSAITGYTVSCTDGSATWTHSGASSPLTVTDLTNATEYSCTVLATNAVGDSEASVAAVGTPYTVPDAPVLASLTRGDETLTVAFSAGAANGRAITGFTLTCDDGDTPVSTSGTESPLQLSGLANGTSYTCTVLATNEAGSSVPSNELAATPATVPGAPAITSVSFEGTQATVYFSAPESDGGVPITSYTVHCAPVSSGDTPDAVTLDEAVPAPVTVTGLTANAAYTCWVVAANEVGSSS